MRKIVARSGRRHATAQIIDVQLPLLIIEVTDLGLEEGDAVGHQHEAKFSTELLELFPRSLSSAVVDIARKVLVADGLFGGFETETLNIEDRLRPGRSLALFKGAGGDPYGTCPYCHADGSDDGARGLDHDFVRIHPVGVRHD